MYTSDRAPFDSRALVAIALLLVAGASVASGLVRIDVDATLDRATIGSCTAPGQACRNRTVSLRPDGERIVALGADRLLNGPDWLEPQARPVEVEFRLPAGMAVSFPGTPLDAELTRYVLRPKPGGWNAVLAIGRFEQRAVELPGGRLDVTVLDGVPAPDVEALTAWVAAAARHVLGVYGRFPVPRAQVIVTPVVGIGGRFGQDGREAVPFGRVLRDGGIGVQFFVRQTAALDAFLSDWTATHEFSHLLLPYVRRDDAWLSEGFASYYQNVLRARAGVLDERVAWQKLTEGFARGRRDDHRETLAEAVRGRGHNRLMRMYWSGAAIALLADVALRRDLGTSLDAALDRLQRCCLPSDRAWSARDVMIQLDRGLDVDRFEALRRRWVDATDFPDVDGTLTALGVRCADGRVVLDDTAPLAAVRRQIMRDQYTPASSPAASVNPRARARSSASSVSSPVTTSAGWTSTKG